MIAKNDRKRNKDVHCRSRYNYAPRCFQTIYAIIVVDKGARDLENKGRGKGGEEVSKEEEGFKFRAIGKAGMLGLLIFVSIPFFIGLIVGLMIK